MDWWQSLRYAHIVAGILAFVVAPIALASAKGGKAHRRFGMVYLLGMTFATLSASLLAATTDNTFFTFVGLFSFYLGFSGYRAIGKRTRVLWVDWVVAVVIACAMLGMLCYGAIGLAGGKIMFLPLVCFGIVGTLIVGRDLKQLVRPPSDRKAWFFGHMIGMVSSAIAAMSAFSVTNLTFLDPVTRILWPAVVGIPILAIWIARYKRKFSAGVRLEDTAIVRSP